MNKLLMLAGFFASMLLFSCSSDDEGAGGSSNLTGTWKLIYTDAPAEMVSDGLYLIQFKKDGTCITVSDDEDGIVVTNGKYSVDDQHIKFVSTDEDDLPILMTLDIIKRNGYKIHVSVNVLGFAVSGFLEKVSDSEIEKYIGKDDVKQGLRVNGEKWKQNKNEPPVYNSTDEINKRELYATFYKDCKYWWPDRVEVRIVANKENIRNNTNLIDLLRLGKYLEVEIFYQKDWLEDNDVWGCYRIDKDNYSKTSGSLSIRSIVAKGDLVLVFDNLTVPLSYNLSENDVPGKINLDGVVTFKYSDE